MFGAICFRERATINPREVGVLIDVVTTNDVIVTGNNWGQERTSLIAQTQCLQSKLYLLS